MGQEFSWSWTKLDKWRSCPKRYYEVSIAKNFPDDKTDALMWGDTFHKAIASSLETGAVLPKEMQQYTKLLAPYQDVDDIKVELKLAIDREFQPSAWDAWDKTWFRGIVDVLVFDFDNRQAAAVDWKTGKNIKPEYEQLALNAQLIFSHHPEIEAVHTAYHWVAHGTKTRATHTRETLVKLWGRLLPEVKRLERATQDLNFPARRSGLCKRHCPVTTCIYNGRDDNE